MDIVAMPQLGETVTEGTITLWSKAVGDPVEVDDALFEVSTEKVDTEVPSAVAGVLRAVLVAEGDTVAVGTPVAVITATADEEVDLDAVPGASAAGSAAGSGREAASPPSRRATDRQHEGAEAPTSRSGSGARTGPGSARLSPVVRRLLDEHGLDPASIAGSGRDGRITRADVLAVAAQGPPAAAPTAAAPAASAASAAPPSRSAPTAPAPTVLGERDEVVDFSKARTATAEHMSRSLATAAHALVAVEVDYHPIDPVRRAAGLSYLPFVARAVIDAIREFPEVNSSVDGDRLVVHRDVNLGVAVDVDQEALMVPVLHGADGLRLRAIADGVADLADKARRRRLPGDAFSGGTFTLTNVGSYGTFVTVPIINQPQVAILSTDGVRMAPVAVRVDDGTGDASTREWSVAVHPVGNLCLSFDHRAFDGAYAAAFLARVREILQTRDWAGEVSS